MSTNIIRDTIREILREELQSLLGDASVPATEQPTNRRQTVSQTATDDDQPTGRMAARVTYHVVKGASKKTIGALKGNNARVFAVVQKTAGLTKRQIWAKVKAHVSTPKSAESNIYQLQTLGLIESREA